MRLGLSLALVVFWMACALQPVFGQSKPERKIYTDKNLANARNALKNHMFKNREVGKVFALDNKEVVGVVLDITREGRVVREIKISFRTSKDKELKSLETLSKSDDPDFRALVDRLKLSE